MWTKRNKTNMSTKQDQTNSSRPHWALPQYPLETRHRVVHSVTHEFNEFKLARFHGSFNNMSFLTALVLTLLFLTTVFTPYHFHLSVKLKGQTRIDSACDCQASSHPHTRPDSPIDSARCAPRLGRHQVDEVTSYNDHIWPSHLRSGVLLLTGVKSRQ